MTASLEKQNLKVKVEFTAPHTPEQNGKVKRSFATLLGKTRAMLNGGAFPEDMRENYGQNALLLRLNLTIWLLKKKERVLMKYFIRKSQNWIQN